MLAYVFVVVAIAFRFLPQTFGFTPITASLLYFGARAPRKWMWAPLLLMAGADLYLTRVVYHYPFTADQLVVWGWYAAMILLGGLLKKKGGWARIAGASLAGSVSFFVVSNFAVWLVWNMYPKTLGGLAACYTLALPFFRNGVMSDLLFTAAFFGIGAMVGAREPAEAKLPVVR
ncbi:MAG TPA: DUF6580 family putative transport protein [Terriglobales bacterium]|jgi:hypothetical protein|nr:DUF6580 family putative transport protein [Terriglobales bacterium]